MLMCDMHVSKGHIDKRLVVIQISFQTWIYLKKLENNSEYVLPPPTWEGEKRGVGNIWAFETYLDPLISCAKSY